jgi:hypothetical protein
MSSVNGGWEASKCGNMNEVEMRKQEGKEYISSPRVDEDNSAVDVSLFKGKAFTPRSEGSDGDGEDNGEDQDSDDEASDGGKSGGEARGNDFNDDDHSDDDHSQDEASHDDDSHGEERCDGCKCQHTHDNQSDYESTGSENHGEKQKYSMAVKNPAGAIHECSEHKLLSVLLCMHFKDTLIDHSRRYTSQPSITGNAEDSITPENQEVQRLKALLDAELAKLVVGIDPSEGAMSCHKRRTLLRYTVKLEIFVGQDRANIPLLQFNNYSTRAVSGKEALGLIKNVDEIIMDVLAYINAVVASKGVTCHGVEDCLCDDEVTSSASLEESPNASGISTADEDEQFSEASTENLDSSLESRYGHRLFSVSLNTHFKGTTENHSQTFMSDHIQDRDSIVELCDLDFQHLLRLIEIPCNELLNWPGLSKEEDLTADERQEQERFNIQIFIPNGPDREETREYIIYTPSPFKDEELPQVIRASFESHVSYAVKTIDAIHAEREMACKQPGYDPSSVIPDFEARRILEKDSRIADRETEVGREAHIVQDTHA